MGLKFGKREGLDAEKEFLKEEKFPPLQNVPIHVVLEYFFFFFGTTKVENFPFLPSGGPLYPNGDRSNHFGDIGS